MPDCISTDNVKTGSAINRQSVQSAQAQTAAYSKSSASTASNPVIHERADNSPADVSGIQTGASRPARAQAMPFFDAVAAARSQKISPPGIAKKTGSTLMGQDDLETQSAGAVIMAADASAEAFRLAQKAVEAAPAAAKAAAGGIRTVQSAGARVKAGCHMARNAGAEIMRATANGETAAEAAKEAIKRYSKKIIYASAIKAKAGVKAGIRTAGKGIVRGVAKGVPLAAYKAATRGLPAVGNALQSADNDALQGVGHAASMAGIGIRTGIQGAKATGYMVKTAVNGTAKTAGGMYRAGKFIKDNGLRAAWGRTRRKAAKAAAAAGKGAVHLLMEGAKALGSKIILPLMIIVAAVVAFNGIITAPVNAVAAIFSSTFSDRDSGEDLEIREFLSGTAAGVPRLAADFKQELADKMADSLAPSGAYHIVRLKSPGSGSDAIEPTLDGISSVAPLDEQIIDMIQPLFNAVLLMDYDLEPGRAQAQSLFESMFDRLFAVAEEASTEQCGQDLKTGEGTGTACSECNQIHSLPDCPNPLTGIHSSYACPDCCRLDCPGHDCGDPACYDDPHFCPGCRHSCSGYSYCGAHEVMTYTLSIDGIYGMVAEYFTSPINSLSNVSPRSEDEENRLQALKDYYEIFCEMMPQMRNAYSGGMALEDLGGVDFADGTRAGNRALIDLALSQVGQMGGQPYWSYYGFASRVEWCACFVHWCMRNTPSASPSYPETSNNAGCQAVADYFQGAGQWGDGAYADLAMGDTVFFDWNMDGHTDHIGLVIGRDGEMVYTVEGNSGDAVKIRSYPIGSGVIYGYGLMNY